MKDLAMKKNRLLFLGLAAASLISLLPSGCKSKPKVSLIDDGGGRTTNDFPELAEDVFKKMDGSIELSVEEIKGRNSWNLWCGGNEQFWDRMAREGHALFDLLKTIDTRKRGSRFKELGLINQPGYKQAVKPDRHGLWLDEPISPETAEPASVKPEVFGRASGVMGFRIFDNPDFKGDAIKKWDANRFYSDPDYGVQPNLIRPYRVGISCGSCHIAFHPTNPPADPENPAWENLASAIGNQYIREGPVFAPNVKPGGFFHEMTTVQPPGTSDTSRIATDHINNPNAINAIFSLNSRLSVAEPEELEGGTLLIPTVTTNKMRVPHVLKDGADSVGVMGATIRVFINIGSYSQHWLAQHNPLIGLRAQQPFDIATANSNSVYWQSTIQKAGNIAKFFTRLKPYRLEDAPGGKDYITKDEAIMTRGKVVFAENCARCHSSKRPPAGADDEEWFRNEVLKPDFREDNFFSEEKRHSVARIKSNSARAAATNAKKGHVWANFSSKTYKELPAVEPIDVWNPYTGQNEKYTIPGGGPGYYRTPSLISIWSSAPFLHNNALGIYSGDPSVKGRMEAFADAVEKMLWPEKRLGTNSIWRTTRECNIQIQAAVIPPPLRTLLKRHIDDDGYFRMGPIPEGTPVNLLGNIDPDTDPAQLVKLALKIKKTLLEIRLKKLDSAAAKKLMRDELAAELFKASKCPDLVEDRGHTFGSELEDADKRALIEYLKTL
jgi:hypothetical protein